MATQEENQEQEKFNQKFKTIVVAPVVSAAIFPAEATWKGLVPWLTGKAYNGLERGVKKAYKSVKGGDSTGGQNLEPTLRMTNAQNKTTEEKEREEHSTINEKKDSQENTVESSDKKANENKVDSSDKKADENKTKTTEVIKQEPSKTLTQQQNNSNKNNTNEQSNNNTQSNNVQSITSPQNNRNPQTINTQQSAPTTTTKVQQRTLTSTKPPASFERTSSPSSQSDGLTKPLKSGSDRVDMSSTNNSPMSLRRSSNNTNVSANAGTMLNANASKQASRTALNNAFESNKLESKINNGSGNGGNNNSSLTQKLGDNNLKKASAKTALNNKLQKLGDKGDGLKPSRPKQFNKDYKQKFNLDSDKSDNDSGGKKGNGSNRQTLNKKDISNDLKEKVKGKNKLKKSKPSRLKNKVGKYSKKGLKKGGRAILSTGKNIVKEKLTLVKDAFEFGDGEETRNNPAAKVAKKLAAAAAAKSATIAVKTVQMIVQLIIKLIKMIIKLILKIIKMVVKSLISNLLPGIGTVFSIISLISLIATTISMASWFVGCDSENGGYIDEELSEADVDKMIDERGNLTEEQNEALRFLFNNVGKEDIKEELKKQGKEWNSQELARLYAEKMGYTLKGDTLEQQRDNLKAEGECLYPKEAEGDQPTALELQAGDYIYYKNGDDIEHFAIYSGDQTTCEIYDETGNLICSSARLTEGANIEIYRPPYPQKNP